MNPYHEQPIRGPMQGRSVIGECTESLHRFILDGWNQQGSPPRIEEDLEFEPKDREEVVYVYMYRVQQNAALLNPKSWRSSRVTVRGPGDQVEYFWERPPLYLDLHYLIAVHSKFRSDAERLLGWLLLRLNEATHLLYRPRRYLLPDGREVDSEGRVWAPEPRDGAVMEKVSLALVDDMTLGDAINFFTLHEAPYRPFLTYRARCAMEGSLITAQPTIVRTPGVVSSESEDGGVRPNGRLAGRPPVGARPRPVGIPESAVAYPIESGSEESSEDGS